MSPILIIGAGPVGLVMAAELARYGAAVRIIDKSARPTETSKALVVWSRSLELIERMGCVDRFLDAGLRARRATIRGTGGAELGHTNFDLVASPYNFALMIPQSETERLLAEHLRSFGVEVERELTLMGFAQQTEVVAAKLMNADGHEETVETPWLIGCDGAHSTVRHGLGLEFRGFAQGDNWLLADVRLEGDGAPPGDEVAPYLHRDGPFVIFPIPGGRARIIADLGPAEAAADIGRQMPVPTLADVQALIDKRTGGGFRALDPVWLTYFRINERKVADYRYGRIFLAGDAAHVHSPAGGQGMNTGIQDAVNLAWKLAMVVRGDGATSLLDSYSAERSAVGDMVLRNAARLTGMATLSNPAAQIARNVAMRVLLSLGAVQHRVATTMSETDIGYRNNPLCAGHGAGRRFEPEHYNGLPPGAGVAPRFVLYTSHIERGAALAKRFPGELENELRMPPDTRDLLAVRPDGYVGFAGKAQDWSQLEAYLVRIERGG